MGTDALVTYLNDHLAGAAAALELIAHIQDAHADEPIAAVIGPIRADIEADRRELEMLVQKFPSGSSSIRKAAAWLSERLLLLKLRVDDPADGGLRLFEAVELLSVGIEGKKGLWSALAASASVVPELQGLDYDRLMARADQQRSVIEPFRLDAARAAFASTDAA